VRFVCVDTGFLIGLYGDRDQYRPQASAQFARLFGSGNNRLVIPWPILYETISTRLTKNIGGMVRLERDWNRLGRLNRLKFLPDEQYRRNVIQDCFEHLPHHPPRCLSAVDRVIRNMLADPALQISAFVTTNPGDFADVCTQFKRELIF